MKWATQVFKPYITDNIGEAKFLLFQDSVAAQKTKNYARAVKSIGGECVFGASQPIDCGHIGAIVKAIGIKHFEDWLQTESVIAGTKNLEAWLDNKVSMKDMSQWKFPK